MNVSFVAWWSNICLAVSKNVIVDSLFTLQFSKRDKKRQKTLTGSA